MYIDDIQYIKKSEDIDFGLIDYIVDSVRLLYKNDYYLLGIDKFRISRGDHASERSIMFRMAYYLQLSLSNDNAYRLFNLDCEYNRNGNDKKRLEAFCNGVFPDIIIHKRRSNKNNLAVIELKGYWNNNQSEDIRKLKGFTSPEEEYKYQIGLAILFGESFEKTDIRFFVKGEEVQFY